MTLDEARAVLAATLLGPTLVEMRHWLEHGGQVPESLAVWAEGCWTGLLVELHRAREPEARRTIAEHCDALEAVLAQVRLQRATAVRPS